MKISKPCGLTTADAQGSWLFLQAKRVFLASHRAHVAGPIFFFFFFFRISCDIDIF